MFDLHMHTNLSDGALSVEQLLERIKENNIQPFSITDHNHALAYDYIKEDIPYLIKGVELTTSFEGTIIEILGYHIEPYIINDWYHEFYSDTNLIANETMLFNDLKYLANQLGYPIPEHLEMETIVKGISKKTIYAYLKEHYPAY
ncbi:MAG: PHP domain-containing protein, partial [Erysipelothrix sp.]|nr:PHP domain-containing protein [Erysipelothrix sp.]